MTTKRFPICDVFMGLTGRLFSPKGMSAAYKFYSYMAGESVFTHQIPRVAREVQPWMRKQFPDLAIVADAIPEEFASQAECLAWLAEVEAAHGKFRMVEKMPGDDHVMKDPIQELTEIFGTEGVIVVKGDAGVIVVTGDADE